MKMLMIALVAVGMIGPARADEDVVEAPKTYVNNPSSANIPTPPSTAVLPIAKFCGAISSSTNAR